MYTGVSVVFLDLYSRPSGVRLRRPGVVTLQLGTPRSAQLARRRPVVAMPHCDRRHLQPCLLLQCHGPARFAREWTKSGTRNVSEHRKDTTKTCKTHGMPCKQYENIQAQLTRCRGLLSRHLKHARMRAGRFRSPQAQERYEFRVQNAPGLGLVLNKRGSPRRAFDRVSGVLKNFVESLL